MGGHERSPLADVSSPRTRLVPADEPALTVRLHHPGSCLFRRPYLWAHAAILDTHGGTVVIGSALALVAFAAVLGGLAVWCFRHLNTDVQSNTS